MKIRRQWILNNFVIVISKILLAEIRRNKSQCERKVYFSKDWREITIKKD